MPVPSEVHSLDPSVADSAEHAETVGNIFETLTRNIEGGEDRSWLASEIDSEEGGTRFRFRLEARSPLSRRAQLHGARRPLLLRADSPEREEPEPVAPLADPGGVGAPERQVERARGPEDRLSHRARPRAGKAGVVLPGDALRMPASRSCPRARTASATTGARDARARVRSAWSASSPASCSSSSGIRATGARIPEGGEPRLPVRRPARGDQEGVPGRPALDRLGSPSCRCRRAAP